MTEESMYQTKIRIATRGARSRSVGLRPSTSEKMNDVHAVADEEVGILREKQMISGRMRQSSSCLTPSSETVPPKPQTPMRDATSQSILLEQKLRYAQQHTSARKDEVDTMLESTAIEIAGNTDETGSFGRKGEAGNDPQPLKRLQTATVLPGIAPLAAEAVDVEAEIKEKQELQDLRAYREMQERLRGTRETQLMGPTSIVESKNPITALAVKVEKVEEHQSESNKRIILRVSFCLLFLLGAIVVGVPLAATLPLDSVKSLSPTLSPSPFPTEYRSGQPTDLYITPTARPSPPKHLDLSHTASPVSSESPSVQPTSTPSFVPSVAKSMQPTTRFELDWYCVANPEQYGCSFEETSIPPRVDTSCESILSSIELQYRVRLCSNGSRNDCEDYNGGTPSLAGNQAYVVVLDYTKRYTFFQGWISEGDNIEVQNSKGFGLYQRVAIYSSDEMKASDLLQTAKYRTWLCAPPVLEIGEVYGSMEVVQTTLSADTVALPAPTTFEITTDIQLQYADDASSPLSLRRLIAATSFAGLIDATSYIDNTVLLPGDSFVPIQLQLGQTLREFSSGSRTASIKVDIEGADQHGDTCSQEHSFVFPYGLATDSPTPSPTSSMVPANSSECSIQTKLACRLTSLCGPFDLEAERF